MLEGRSTRGQQGSLIREYTVNLPTHHLCSSEERWDGKGKEGEVGAGVLSFAFIKPAPKTLHFPFLQLQPSTGDIPRRSYPEVIACEELFFIFILWAQSHRLEKQEVGPRMVRWKIYDQLFRKVNQSLIFLCRLFIRWVHNRVVIWARSFLFVAQISLVIQNII